MKCIVKVVSAALLLAFTMNITAAADTATPVEDKTLVPLRYICEAQGAKVDWDGNTKTVTVVKENDRLSFKPGTDTASVNGKDVNLDESISAVNGRIKVPLFLINKALNTKITKDDCIRILADKYLNLLRQGSISDCRVLFSDDLNGAFSDSLITSLSTNLKMYGNIKEQNVSVHKTGVHMNVTMRYASISGAIDIIARFNSDVQIDDYIMVPVVPGGTYKAPEYEKSDSFTEEEVVIGEGKWMLPGTLTMPRGKGPFAAVVLVHGSGPNDRDETIGPVKPFRDIAVGLAANNIAVLRYDKRSYEHNIKFAAIEKMTVKDETIDDAVEAVNFLSKNEKIDASKIFVLGHSQGGMLMPRIIGADIENKIRGAVIMSGNSRPLEDLILEQFNYLTGLHLATKQQLQFYERQIAMIKDEKFSAENPPKGFALGMPYWWMDIRNYRAAEAAKNLSTPLLILQGGRDYQVTAAGDFQGWKDALSDRDSVTFKLYPKLNHIYTEGEGEMSTPMEYYKQGNMPAYVIEDITNWIEDILKK